MLQILPLETEERTYVQEIFKIPNQVHSSEETFFILLYEIFGTVSGRAV